MEHSNSTGIDPGSGRGVMDRVRDSATAQLSNQKDRATNGLGTLAEAVRQTTQPLRENKQDVIAQYVEKAADHLDRFSTRLRERDVKDLVQDVQQFARRRPALFVGAAFAVGVIAARFLKSSAGASQRGAMERYGRPDARFGGTSPSREGSASGARAHSSGGF